MKILKYIPVFLYLLIICNVIAFSPDGDQAMNAEIFEIRLISGALFSLDLKGVLTILGIIALYIEIFKSTRTSEFSIIDDALSMLVFVAFLTEFIVVKNLGSSAFFIIMLMSLLDVIAGFTVTISTARRDFSVGH